MARKITMQVRVCLLENVLGLKLTLQLLGSHRGVHLEFPFAGGKCCLSPIHNFGSFCLFSFWFRGF